MSESRAEDARSDESLLSDHLAGDAGALELLINRYRGELHGFLTRFLASATAADDVFQETFLQVHLAAASFDVERSFKPWLFTIAANKARDFHRKRKRRQMASLDAPVSAGDDRATLEDMVAGDLPLPEVRSIEADQRREVKAALDTMPEGQREIILLAYFQKLSYQQIAEMLSIPLGTVKSRMHAAVALFSQRWGDAHDETGAAARSGDTNTKGTQRRT